MKTKSEREGGRRDQGAGVAIHELGSEAITKAGLPPQTEETTALLLRWVKKCPEAFKLAKTSSSLTALVEVAKLAASIIKDTEGATELFGESPTGNTIRELRAIYGESVHGTEKNPYVISDRYYPCIAHVASAVGAVELQIVEINNIQLGRGLKKAEADFPDSLKDMKELAQADRALVQSALDLLKPLFLINEAAEALNGTFCRTHAELRRSDFADLFVSGLKAGIEERAALSIAVNDQRQQALDELSLISGQTYAVAGLVQLEYLHSKGPKLITLPSQLVLIRDAIEDRKIESLRSFIATERERPLRAPGAIRTNPAHAVSTKDKDTDNSDQVLDKEPIVDWQFEKEFIAYHLEKNYPSKSGDYYTEEVRAEIVERFNLYDEFVAVEREILDQLSERQNLKYAPESVLERLPKLFLMTFGQRGAYFKNKDNSFLNDLYKLGLR